MNKNIEILKPCCDQIEYCDDGNSEMPHEMYPNLF